MYTSRTRGNSDNLLSNSSTLLSALSGSMYRNDEDGAVDEEYKSEDEMRRVLSETSEEGSNAGSPTVMRRVKRNKAKVSRTGERLRELGHARKRYDDDSMSSASEFSDGQANSDKDRGEGGALDEEPFLQPDQMCGEHNLKIHSW